MKKRNLIITTSSIIVALFALLLSLGSAVLGNLSFIPITGFLSYSYVILVVLAIVFGIVMISQIIHERQINGRDNKPAIEKKDITISFNLGEGPITIEAFDAKSAAEVFEEIHENLMKRENLLKAESHSEMKETMPQTIGITANGKARGETDSPNLFDSNLSQNESIDLQENEK